MKKEKRLEKRLLLFAFLTLHLKKHLELIAWISGLIYLAAFVNPNIVNFSFCVFKMLGIDACWGCGLGRSVAYLFDGNFIDSFKTHPLGIFATFILFYRIFELSLQPYFKSSK